MEQGVRHIHMLGICGVGMAPFAVMLKDAGYRVTGSDNAAFPPMSEVLAEAGIAIMEGFSPAHLEPRPDLVIVGNALPRTNVEACEVERLGIERISFPAALSRLFLDGRRSLVVSGTHGKTTTTGMLARCLQVAGLDPGYLVGGRVRDLGRLAYGGSGEFFVVEGDEYDTAYFDKGPKFLHYRPAAVIMTSVEFDHADIYRDVEHVRSSFRKLVELLPAGAPLVGCADYPHLLAAVAGAGTARLISYGESAGAEWRAHAVELGATASSFAPAYKGGEEGRITLRLPGRMNVMNALATYVLCRELGVDLAAVAEALAEYKGAARRQEVVGEAGGVTVIDDFAHHPTAVAATLAAIRERYRGRRLRAVFEPRSNTSRRAVFQQRYAEALAVADTVALSQVFAKENDPLAADEMLSTDTLVADLRARGVQAWSAPGPDAIFEQMAGDLSDGDVVVCMSNGAFGNLARRLAVAAEGGAAGPV